MARERYLLHAGEEEINRRGAEITLKTRKDKWNHFWYYYRVHVIVGLIAAAFVGFLICDMVTKVQPDYNIGVISSYLIPSDISEQLSEELEKYGCDRNGDGDVVVQVNVYEIAQGEAAENTDPNMQIAGYVKLSGDLQTGGSYIFLTDDASFVAYGTEEGMFSYLDGSIPEEGATDYENMRLPVSECKGLAGTEIGEIFTDYSFSLRQIRDDLLEDDPQYYLDAKELFLRTSSTARRSTTAPPIPRPARRLTPCPKTLPETLRKPLPKPRNKAFPPHNTAKPPHKNSSPRRNRRTPPRAAPKFTARCRICAPSLTRRTSSSAASPRSRPGSCSRRMSNTCTSRTRSRTAASSRRDAARDTFPSCSNSIRARFSRWSRIWRCLRASPLWSRRARAQTFRHTGIHQTARRLRRPPPSCAD